MNPARLHVRSVVLALGFLGALSVLAQSAQETVITSHHFESESTDKEMTAVFWGNVDLTGTNLHITCDRLEVVYLRRGEKDQVIAKQNQFKSFIATGKVKIVQGDREASCGRAVVLPNEDKVTLTGNPIVFDRSADVTFIGEPLELLRGERRVHGENVKIVGPELRDLGFDKNKALDGPGLPPKPEEKK
jgi:lipopolysaccharide export system protein LptA